MKTQASAPVTAQLLIVIAAIQLVASGRLVRASAPGDLDLKFDPASTGAVYFGANFFQAGDQIYFDRNRQIIRYGADGKLDPTWNAPLALRPTADSLGEIQLADGRIALQTMTSSMALFSATGKLLLVGSANIWPYHEVYPNLDGTWTLVAQGSPSSFGPWPQFVSENLIFPILRPPVPPWRASESQDIGGGIGGGNPISSEVTSARDSGGRIVEVGNVTSVDGLERLGMARFLPDGTLDRSWNPGATIGLTVDPNGTLNGLPKAVAAGPDSEIETVVRFPNQPDGQRNVFARIRADGSLARRTRVAGFEYSAAFPIAVQPDGRTLVGGSFTNWNGRTVTGLVRLNLDGSLDDSFQVALASSKPVVGVFRMGLQSDGYLWIAGYFETVNGVARPGLARVFAYSPTPQAPTLRLERTQSHIDTNETLHLSAQVSGSPRPQFQWLSNGVPIPGATFRGLQATVGNMGIVPTYELVASNALGVARLTFPPIPIARRTPPPGKLNSNAPIQIPQFGYISYWLSLPDGASLLAGTMNPVSLNSPLSETNRPMLARLSQNRRPDPDFGTNGFVWGNGHVEKLVLEPDGRIWVMGHFTEIAGHTAAGSVFLDMHGHVIEASWPTLDTPIVMAGLRLPDGRRLLSGVFERVNGQSASRLVRLTVQGAVDDTFTSPLTLYQLIDDLAIDRSGRVLAAGVRTLQLPVQLRIQRLLADGAWDTNFNQLPATIPLPAFEATGLLPLPDGRLLLRNPPVLLSADGNVEAIYQLADGSRPPFGAQQPGPTVLLGFDGMVYAIIRTSIGGPRIYRWSLSGKFDFGYEAFPPTTALDAQRVLIPEVSSLQFGPEGDLAVFARSIAPADPLTPLIPVTGIQIFPGDADHRLRLERESPDKVSVKLPTLAGRTYGIWKTPNLTSLLGERIAEFQGDGYEQSIFLPSKNPVQFFRLGQ